MAQTNIYITGKSELDLVKINSKLIDVLGDKLKNKTDLINVCIGIAVKSIGSMDSDSISKVVVESLKK